MGNTNLRAGAEDDGYLDVPALAQYSGLSISTLRRALTDAEHPLPHHHVRLAGKTRGRVLIEKQAFREWLRDGRDAPVDAPPGTPDGRWVRGRR